MCLCGDGRWSVRMGCCRRWYFFRIRWLRAAPLLCCAFLFFFLLAAAADRKSKPAIVSREKLFYGGRGLRLSRKCLVNRGTNTKREKEREREREREREKSSPAITRTVLQGRGVQPERGGGVDITFFFFPFSFFLGLSNPEGELCLWTTQPVRIWHVVGVQKKLAMSE